MDKNITKEIKTFKKSKIRAVFYNQETGEIEEEIKDIDAFLFIGKQGNDAINRLGGKLEDIVKILPKVEKIVKMYVEQVADFIKGEIKK